MSWDQGYVSEVTYTHGYYKEISPVSLNFALLSAGQRSRPLKAPLYLELGYGQGVSINIHAAACPGEYWGTDFNPSHALNAQYMADASGADLNILEASFEQLAARSDLPKFDVITLHGIWSWVSRENRENILRIIRNNLAPGGVVYISYNCTPGWSPAMPLQHLFSIHANLAESDASGIEARISKSIEFAKRLVDSDALFFKANPGVAKRLEQVSAQNRTYLAHEYLNAHWAPMPFSEVAENFQTCKLNFGASATLMEHLPSLRMGQKARQIIAEISHPVLRETITDYLVNQQFRKDIWMRGGKTLSAQARAEAVFDLELALLKNPSEIGLKIQSPIGEVTLQEDIYQPIIAAIGETHTLLHNGADGANSSRSIGHLHQQLSRTRKGSNPVQLIEAVTVLMAAGHLSVAQPFAAQQAVSQRCRALNRYIAESSRSNSEIGYLASPVTGGGVSVSRFDQLFLLESSKGSSSSESLAARAWETLKTQGQKLVRDGKPVETAEENIAGLQVLADSFLTSRSSRLKTLGVEL